MVTKIQLDGAHFVKFVRLEDFPKLE